VALDDIRQLWAGGKPWAALLEEWSAARESALPDLSRLIDRFRDGSIALSDFSQSLDRLSKRQNLWGYSGHSGQMFFNVLLKASDHAALEEELRAAIDVPEGEGSATEQIDAFVSFVRETQVRAAIVGRFPPKAGYIPYFLSFFWEAKDRDWPIYYPNSRRALVQHGLFRETGPFSQRYALFRKEVLHLRAILQTSTWGVEALLYSIAVEDEAPRRGAESIPAPRLVVPVEVAEQEVEELSALSDKQSLELVLNELAATNDRVSLARAEQTASWRDVHGYLEAISLGLDTDAVSLPRFIEVVVYIAEAQDASEVEAATLALTDASGFVLADEFPPVRRSFWRRFTARTRELASRPEVETRLRELERAVQIQGIDLPQAQVDALQASAAAQLIESLNGQSQAAIKIGSILVLKLDDQLIVTTLTPGEMLQLSREPTLLSAPQTLLASLRPAGNEALPPGHSKDADQT
jgi:hypothetical protein